MGRRNRQRQQATPAKPPAPARPPRPPAPATRMARVAVDDDVWNDFRALAGRRPISEDEAAVDLDP